MQEESDVARFHKRLSEVRINNSRLEQDLLAIFRFFNNKKLVLKYLSEFAYQYHHFCAGKETGTNFRNFFTAWGQGHGFNQAMNGKTVVYKNEHAVKLYHAKTDLPASIPTLVGIVPARLFTNLFLRQGYLISDPGAGVLHGKWTHSLQVFMLQEALIHKDIELFSCDSIKSLLRQMGCHRQGHLIFGALLDSNQATDDYSRPEALLKLLMTDETLTDKAGILAVRAKVEKYNAKVGNAPEAYTQRKFDAANKYIGVVGEQRGFLWGKREMPAEREDVPVEKQVTPLDMLNRMLKRK